MSGENGRNFKKEVQLKDLLKVLVRGKWWFIGVFIIVFIAGILFTFLRTPQFNLTSTLSVSNITPDYYENLIQRFPKKTGELLRISNISESEELLSEDLLMETAENLEFDIDVNELKDTIFIYTKQAGVLRLTTVYNNEERTYIINKVLLETYLDNRTYDINQTYQALLNEVELKISTIAEEIDVLSEKSDNKDILVSEEIELKYETYHSLEEDRNILIDNKDYFTERIIVSGAPDISNVYGYFNYKRDIIFSFSLAIVVGLITAFVVNYFQSLKKK